MKKIAIFSIKDDLHALVIQKIIIERGLKCHLIEVDMLWDENLINIDFHSSNYYLLDNNKEKVEIEGIDVIWWRRSVRGQKYTNSQISDDQKGYSNKEMEAVRGGRLHS